MLLIAPFFFTVQLLGSILLRTFLSQSVTAASLKWRSYRLSRHRQQFSFVRQFVCPHAGPSPFGYLIPPPTPFFLPLFSSLPCHTFTFLFFGHCAVIRLPTLSPLLPDALKRRHQVDKRSDPEIVYGLSRGFHSEAEKSGC